jgi:AcrR family transcriptional regulator
VTATDATRDAPAVARPPGRPRSEAADAAILEATVELYGDLGFAGLSVDAVAARAGVSKATIYRRYPSKVELVMAAGERLADREHPAIDTGTVRGDLTAHARALIRMLKTSDVGRCVPTMVADKKRFPELAAAHDRFSATRRARMRAAVERGVARGELRPDTDCELVVDLLAGPAFYGYLVSGRRLDGAYAEQLVDALLVGFLPAQ